MAEEVSETPLSTTNDKCKAPRFCKDLSLLTGAFQRSVTPMKKKEENKGGKQQPYLVHSLNSMLCYLGFLQWLMIISSVSYSPDESADWPQSKITVLPKCHSRTRA